MNSKKGFMNVFFVGALILLLSCSLILTEEAGEMRLKRIELELMLQFDYRLEAYYLLISSGQLLPETDVSYGSMTEYELIQTFSEERNIRIIDLVDKIQVMGNFNGEERGYYEIRK